MKEELYQWIKNLAVFYILFTAVLHLVPDKKYERYVRSFMGLLLIYMLCTPVWVIFGKSRELMENFHLNFQEEQNLMEQMETESLQAFYLNQGYEEEFSKKIMESLADIGIKVSDTAVNIEGEKIRVKVYLDQELAGDQERRIYDALRQDFGIEEEDCQVFAGGNGKAAVGSSSSSGTSAGGDCASGIRSGEERDGSRE